MVMARLHTICGNCGCSDDFEWKFAPKEIFEGEANAVNPADVLLVCNNCTTIHSLNDNASERKEI
jgi:hypothetical protein